MKLLVSPKNKKEAITALRGGADIIDVKNPSEGSLGANFPWVIRDIKKIIPGDKELSATIGDFPNLPGTASLAALGAATCGVDYVKVGLFGIKNSTDAVKFMSKVVRAVKNYDNRIKVVACGYADCEVIGSVNILQIPQIAKKSKSDIAMIDTAIKGSKNLFDLLSMDELETFVRKAHTNNLLVALGGSIKKNHLRPLSYIDVDIVGVRGAVCKSGRNSEIDLKKVKELSNIVNS